MTENNISTIRLMPDGFCFAEQFYPIAPGADFDTRFEETLFDADIANKAYSEEETCRCIVETNRISLSPTSISEAEAEQMFQFANTASTNDEVLLHAIDSKEEIRFTYSIPTRIYHFLQRSLPGLRFCLDACEMYEAHLLEHGMIVKANTSALSILAYSNGTLLQCNRIETQGINNQCYFIMSTWAQLGFDPIEDKLLLQTDDEQLRKTLNTYIKCVL